MTVQCGAKNGNDLKFYDRVVVIQASELPPTTCHRDSGTPFISTTSSLSIMLFILMIGAVVILIIMVVRRHTPQDQMHSEVIGNENPEQLNQERDDPYNRQIERLGLEMQRHAEPQARNARDD